MELKPRHPDPQGQRTTVLIVPFMELKLQPTKGRQDVIKVLIVPFMELKLHKIVGSLVLDLS